METTHLNAKKHHIFISTLSNFHGHLTKLLNLPLSLSASEIKNGSKLLQGEGMDIIILSNFYQVRAMIELSLGEQISGHTITLSEGSILVNETSKKDQIQHEQKNRESSRLI